MSSQSVNSKLFDFVVLICVRHLQISFYCGKLGQNGWRHEDWSACAACNTNF